MERKPFWDPYAVGMSAERFQLQHAGHLMLRAVNSAPDPRVKGFFPDEWQRQLMDVIDRRESALVVGPTSSGAFAGPKVGLTIASAAKARP